MGARRREGRMDAAAARTRDLEGRIGDFYLNGFFTKAPSRKWALSHKSSARLRGARGLVKFAAYERSTATVFSLFTAHSDRIAWVLVYSDQSDRATQVEVPPMNFTLISLHDY